MQQVITFESPSGAKLDLCLKHQHVPTHDDHGQEHCSIHKGQNVAASVSCAVCVGNYDEQGEYIGPNYRDDYNEAENAVEGGW